MRSDHSKWELVDRQPQNEQPGKRFQSYREMKQLKPVQSYLMEREITDIRELLFSMVAPGEGLHSRMRAPHDDEWDQLLRIARQHRLEPMLHWRARADRTIAGAPQRFRDAIAATFRLQALRSLQLQLHVAAVHQAMRARDIPAIFLKGAFLAFHVYPHPALRPLRDLDVLVPRDQALLAFESLLRAGFKRHSEIQGSAQAWLECRKHLPPLVTADGYVSVEIHAELTEVPPGTGGLFRSANEQLWERSIEQGVLGEQIRYLSPTDQLLHIIVHAVYDHRLDNGPLVLHDIAGLLGHTELNWPLFWAMAEDGGWARGCWLLLSVLSQLDPSLVFPEPLVATAPVLPENCVDMMALLMLGDAQLLSGIRLRSELKAAQTLSDRGRLMLSRAFPGKSQVAASSSFEGSRPPMADYLNHWWRLATVRLPKVLAAWRDPQTSRHARASATLQCWLADE